MDEDGGGGEDRAMAVLARFRDVRLHVQLLFTGCSGPCGRSRTGRGSLHASPSPDNVDTDAGNADRSDTGLG